MLECERFRHFGENQQRRAEERKEEKGKETTTSSSSAGAIGPFRSMKDVRQWWEARRWLAVERQRPPVAQPDVGCEGEEEERRDSGVTKSRARKTVGDTIDGLCSMAPRQAGGKGKAVSVPTTAAAKEKGTRGLVVPETAKRQLVQPTVTKRQPVKSATTKPATTRRATTTRQPIKTADVPSSAARQA